MAEWINTEVLKTLFKSGSRVYVGGSTNEPHALLDQLAGVNQLHFIQQPIAAVNQRDLSALGAGCTQETYFMTPSLKQGQADNRVNFIPMQMREIFDYLSRQRIDIALLLAAKDINGELRFGLNNDYVDSMLGHAKVLIVEVSDAFISPLGSKLVKDTADYYFASHTPAATFPSVEVDVTSQIIGELVAGLIRDGDCIQTGIGAVPAAILGGLKGRNDLGLHSGIIDDAAMQLVAAGNMNGKAKNIDRNFHVSGMALGTRQLHEWLSTESTVQFRSADYTHDQAVIRQLDNFVSINSAVEIDLFGQVNAEVVAGQQISGTGGSVDFMRAAKASKGGRSIVALSATARRGDVSRIVKQVEMVTALRTDVDLVVTEFGVADLKAASVQERRESLIRIAHPDFRDELSRAS